MTREDAIKTLKELWRETNDSWYEEVYTMAIKALEAGRKSESTKREGQTMRLIDADALAYMVASNGDADFINKVTRLMIDAPSIDIVRCGECIHNGSYDTDCPFGWRNGEWNMPRPCDYCSYGERKDE